MNTVALWFLNLASGNQFTVLLAGLFLTIALGYIIGRINIGGIDLGTSGILIVALFAGHYLGRLQEVMLNCASDSNAGANAVAMISSVLKTIEQFGLVSFVTSVGLIAGPVFFRNLKTHIWSYLLISFIIVSLAAGLCILIVRFCGIDADIAVGLYTGALTSTPGLSAAKEAFGNNAATGYAIGYPFGVIGVVLFVQLIPKLLHADVEYEAAQLRSPSDLSGAEQDRMKAIHLDPLGLFVLFTAAITGLLLGSVNITTTGIGFLGFGDARGIKIFSLGATGGTLIMGLIIGKFDHIGRISLDAPKSTLNTMRELGLAFFLVGAGVSGGKEFVSKIAEYGAILFVFGIAITLIPMIAVFLIAKFQLKLSLFNNLGAICGGMTSTPALGALIDAAKTDNVTAAYASAYPVALLLIVLSVQLFAALF